MRLDSQRSYILIATIRDFEISKVGEVWERCNNGFIQGSFDFQGKFREASGRCQQTDDGLRSGSNRGVHGRIRIIDGAQVELFDVRQIFPRHGLQESFQGLVIGEADHLLHLVSTSLPSKRHLKRTLNFAGTQAW